MTNSARAYGMRSRKAPDQPSVGRSAGTVTSGMLLRGDCSSMRDETICFPKSRASERRTRAVLTIEQIRRIAQQSGARDISKVETDIILTFLLQLFHEKGITAHVAFKGGTMLRKMIFGPRGRYSTDLDFTRRTEITDEDIMELMLDALSHPYRNAPGRPGRGFRQLHNEGG